MKQIFNIIAIILLAFSISYAQEGKYSDKAGPGYTLIDTTAKSDYTVPKVKQAFVTSYCINGTNNVISLTAPSEELRGYIVEVTHFDTSAAQSRTTTVETDGTSYHIYYNFTGDTLTFFNIYQSGQTVRFTLKEIEGVLRWVAVNLSPVVFGDKELTAVGKIRQGEDGDLYAYDSSVSGERKVQYQYTVDSVAEILSMKLRLGNRIKVKSTGAEYLVQADSLENFTTDNISVVEVSSKYALLQPVGDKYLYSHFRQLGVDGGETINNAFSFMKAVRNNNINVNNANNRLDSNIVINTLFLDQQATSSQPIIIPDGMRFIGGNNSIYTDDDATAPPLFFDLNNPSDTAIIFEDKFGGFDSNQYRRGSVKDMVMVFESACNIGIYSLGPMGEVLDNIYIEGNGLVNVGIKTSYTIFAEFNHLRIENCDTSLYISNYKPSTSFTSNFSTYTRGNVGIYIDPYANGSNIEFNRCYIESSSDAYGIIGTGNEVFFNGLETEGDGGTSTPYAQFVIGGNSTDRRNRGFNEGSVAFYNSRLEADVNFTFDIDTLQSLTLVNCDIAPGSGSKEFKATESFKALTVLGGNSTNTALNTGPDRGVLDSVSIETSVSIDNFNVSNGGIDYFVTYNRGNENLTSFDQLYVSENQKIELALRGSGGRIKTSSLIAVEDYPVFIALENNQGDDYEGALFGMIQHQTDKKSAAIKGRSRPLNFASDFSQDISVFESQLDIRNGTGGALGKISGFYSNPSWQNTSYLGALADVAYFRATSPMIRGTRNINILSGLRIENIFTKNPTVNLNQAYGIKIDDLTLNTGTNTWSFYTGIGPIHLGDSTYIANNLTIAGDVDFAELDTLQTQAQQFEANYTFTPFPYNAVDTIPVDTLLSQRFVVTGALDSKTITGVEYTLDSQVTTRSTLVRLLKYTPSTDTYVAFGSASLTVGNSFVTNTPSQTINQGDIIYAEVSQAGDNPSGLTVSLKIE